MRISKERRIHILAFIVVLLLAAYVVAQSLDVLSLNEVAMNTHSQELEGIQGATITATEVQVTKAVKRGKNKDAQTLDSLMKKQMECFKIINTALGAQQSYYSAQTGKDTEKAKTALSSLRTSIPKARSALETLRGLTHKKIELIRASTGDIGAINIENATFDSWAAAVRSLSTDLLTEKQVTEKNQIIAENSSIAIRTAHNMATYVDTNELTDSQKRNLDVNVVSKGEAVIKNLGDVLNVLPKLLASMAQGAAVSMKMTDDALKAYRGKSLEQMMHDASYGQGFFNKENMSVYQKALDSVGMQIQGFLGYYAPFIETVGQKVGRSASVSGTSGASSKGADMVFVDPQGRYLLVGSSKEYSQVLLDRIATKKRPDGDLQMMLVFEYTPEYKKAFLQENKQAASQLQTLAYEFRFLKLSEYHAYRRYATIERNFQDASNREILHLELPATENVPIERNSLMEKARDIALTLIK